MSVLFGLFRFAALFFRHRKRLLEVKGGSDVVGGGRGAELSTEHDESDAQSSRRTRARVRGVRGLFVCGGEEHQWREW